jgi:hypothetical protein
MNEYQYSLFKGSKKWTCPQCGKKTFVCYIENQTEKVLHEIVGRCDRADNCAYHYPPKQYFTDNKIYFEKQPNFTPSFKPTPRPQRIMEKSYIDTKLFEESLQGCEKNTFVKFLYNIVSKEVVQEIVKQYNIGTSEDGGTIFWQMDMFYKIRTGKIIFFDTNGHRRKNVFPQVQWVHSIEKLPDFNLCQCLFGEHLLNDTSKKIIIVESEKTAVISSCLLPEYIWLACGGSEGLNIDKCQCLKGRTVTLYPDAGMYEKWNKKKKELSKICEITVSDLIEKSATDTERQEGFDIADYLIRAMHPKPIQPPQLLQENEKSTVTIPTIPKSKESDIFNMEEDIRELETFFATVTLPNIPIKLNAWTTVNDAKYFIDSSLRMLKANTKTEAYLPYLQRLQQLKYILNNLKTT